MFFKKMASQDDIIQEYKIIVDNELDVTGNIIHNNRLLNNIIDFKGDYISGNYMKNDVVKYNGNTYLCILDTSGQDPSEKTYWTVFSHYIDNRNITVGKSNKGDFNTIQEAINYINTSMTPTSTNPITISVYHGQFIESNPLILPDYVGIMGMGALATQVVGVTTGSPILQLGTGGRVVGLTLGGAYTPGGSGIYFDGQNGVIDNVIIGNCFTGLQVNSGVLTILHVQIIINNGLLTMNKALYVTGTGDVGCQTLGIYRYSGTMNYGIDVDSSGIDPKGSAISIKGANVGLNVTNNGSFRITGGTIDYCNIGIQLDTGGKCNTLSTGIDNSTTWDLSILDASCYFLGLSNRVQANKVNNPFSADIQSFALSTQPGDVGFEVIPKFQVGTYKYPSETLLGGGNSTVETMKIYTKNTSNVYTEHTEAASSPFGSTFNVFSENSIGAELYIGGDYAFPGLRCIVDTATLNTKCMITEFWNGSSWEEFQVMWSEKNGKHITYARKHFHVVGDLHIRFGLMKNWAKTTINSVSKYWIRFKLQSILTTIPVIEQLKLHTNRTEINPDGFIELFGLARSIKLLPWSVNDASSFGFSPSNQNMFITPNIGRGYIENSFGNNSDDRIGNNFKVPLDMDTSFPIIVIWDWKNPSNSGNIYWRIRWAYNSPGEKVSNTSNNATSNAPNGSADFKVLIESVPTTSDQVKQSRLEIGYYDVTPLTPDRKADTLWITLERDGNNVQDTNNSYCQLISINPFYTAWRDGGTISSFYDI